MPKKKKTHAKTHNKPSKQGKSREGEVKTKLTTPSEFKTLLETNICHTSQSKSTKTELQGQLLHDGIFFVNHFLTPKECQSIIQATESIGYTLTDQRETQGFARRRNGRLQCTTPMVADRLWRRCRHLFEQQHDADPVGLSSNFRFYKYEPGDRFGLHVDDSVEHDGGSTYYTLLFYLNGSNRSTLKGGSTNFYTGGSPKKAKLVVSVEPREGGALVHAHYPDCLLHEGGVVLEGTKYLMRTDVVYQLRR